MEITLAENKLGSISALIESEKRLLKQRILLPDALPIWKVGRDAASVDMGQKMDGLFVPDSNILKAFPNSFRCCPLIMRSLPY